MHIKTKMQHYYIPVRIAKMKNSTPSAGKEFSYTAGRSINWYTQFENCLARFNKVDYLPTV